MAERRARSGSVGRGRKRLAYDTTDARARAASGYSAREAMCAREYETCDLLGQVAFALIVPRARPRAARAAVSVTRLFAEDVTRRLGDAENASVSAWREGRRAGKVGVVVERTSRGGQSGVRLRTYRYSRGGVARHRARV